MYIVLLMIIAAGECETTQIRLDGGSTNIGRLEVFYHNHWTSVAYLSQDDAKVACRMLGFNEGNPVPKPDVTAGLFGTNTGQSIVSHFGCLGNETDLANCPTSPWQTNPYHIPATILSCGNTGIRLVDGDRPTLGRVEIQLGLEWTSVCLYSFTTADAQVLCNMLGFGSSGIANFFADPTGSGGLSAHMVTSLSCSGSERDIKECQRLQFRDRSVCNQGKEVGLQCGATPIRLANGPNNATGRVEIFHGGQWGTIMAGYRPTLSHGDVKVICNMLGMNNPNAFGYGLAYYGEGLGPVITGDLNCLGGETDIANCKSSTWSIDDKSRTHTKDIGVNCEGVTTVRLVDGTSEQSGRLEVLRNGHWGTVSGRRFTKQNLEVVCRMLGYESTEGSFYMVNSHYGQGLGEVVVKDLSCNGLEADIGLCQGTWWPSTKTADHGLDVGVDCTGEIPIRLVGGPNNSTGRVEIYHNGRYGTICDQVFDRLDLIVVCRMLGFENIPQSAYYHKSAYYGGGLGEIVVRQLHCNGIENNLGQCQAVWDDHYCDHDNDVSVSCTGATEQVRLVNGSSTHNGRVEILHRGQWGQVCSNLFGRPDAVVICRELDFPNPENAVAISNADVTFGKGQGSWIVDRLGCNGLEENLDLCSASWLPTATTGCHPVGVECCPSCNNPIVG